MLPAKAEKAHQNLAEAGLAESVEIRAGDALQTLATLDGALDLLFLDGSNDLYLSVLQLVERRLRRGSLVAADLSEGDPHHAVYEDYMRDPQHGYVSVHVPLDAGVVLSART